MTLAEWFTEHKDDIATLKLLKNPFNHGLGVYEDADGQKWEVKCIFGKLASPVGKAFVNARKESNLTDEFIPYFFEFIED